MSQPPPELHQASLDPPALEALFADLSRHAEILAVIPKFAPGHVPLQSVELDEGRTLLLEGGLRGLQVRYRFQGDEWWDTLIPAGDAFRITRIKQEYV